VSNSTFFANATRPCLLLHLDLGDHSTLLYRPVLLLRKDADGGSLEMTLLASDTRLGASFALGECRFI
jgi:hypothetical protein